MFNNANQIPALSDDATGVKMGESSACMRYIALKYKPALYPRMDPVACAKIDMAMDNFMSYCYGKHVPIVYHVMGFAPAPPSMAEAAKEYADALSKWASVHLSSGKFVNGDSLSIADYKVVAFVYPAIQPKILEITGFEAPPRILQFVEDFCAASPSKTLMESFNGFSMKEFIATK